MSPSLQLVEQLELLRSLLKSGFTLQASLRMIRPKEDILVSPQFLEEWTLLQRQIEHGELCGSEAIGDLIKKIELDAELADILRKSLSMPMAQGFLCLVIFLGAIVLRICLFDFAVSGLDGIALGLITIAFGIQYQIFCHLQKEKWIHDWLRFLSALEQKIRSGKTPQQAMQESVSDAAKSKIPAPLLSAQPIREAKPRQKFGVLEKSARQSWEILWEAQSQGISLGKLLDLQQNRLRKRILSHYILGGQRAALLSLVPLYFFFLPGCLLGILGPILGQLSL